MNNVTIVVPTHNRHKYLKRSMEYFKNFDAHIIYCDSSFEKYSKELYSNISYLHLPDQNFASKVLIALERVSTSLVALCADDDFILMDSLFHGCSILNNNEKISTVIGKTIFFHEKFDGFFYENSKFHPRQILFSPSENAISFFSDYTQILWGLFRKENLITCYKLIKEANFYNENFFEITIGAISCYFGGVSIIDKIWSIRELTIEEHWGDKHEPVLNIYDNQIHQDYVKFEKLVDQNTMPKFANLVFKSYTRKSKFIQLKLYLKTFKIFNSIYRNNFNANKSRYDQLIKCDSTEVDFLEKIIYLVK
jgi:glycosyltransferase domain-containing protein